MVHKIPAHKAALAQRMAGMMGGQMNKQPVAETCEACARRAGMATSTTKRKGK